MDAAARLGAVVVAVASAVVGAGDVSQAPKHDVRSVRSGRWLDLATWSNHRLPRAHEDVAIAAGHHVDVDTWIGTVGSFVVEKDATLVVDGGLAITALRDVRIDGEIETRTRPSDGYGASIALCAGGDLSVSGSIRTGDAGPHVKRDPAEGGLAPGGGALELRTIAGSVTLTETARLATGDGADGADARADSEDAVVRGGNGGSAGQLFVSAAGGSGEVSIPAVVGILSVGRGGNGGGAFGGSYGEGGAGGDSMAYFLGRNVPSFGDPGFVKWISDRLAPNRRGGG
ncbi:MAG TPA: hypothetical protein VKE69_15300, partial [Planctomycetota bacterium]|nr:hypothetical protein [Planctomycetota bacterium]